MTEKSDEELIILYHAGDEHAFKILIERYTPPLYHFVRRLIGPSSAEDILQDIFLKAWKHLGRFDVSKAHFKTWIFTIARNTATDFLRKRKSVVFSELDGDPDNESFAERIPDEKLLPDELLEKLDEKTRLNAVLAMLPPEYVAVLELHYQEEMTFEEIGRVLGKPMNTVKSHHRRALLKLRKILEESAPEEGI